MGGKGITSKYIEYTHIQRYPTLQKENLFKHNEVNLGTHN